MCVLGGEGWNQSIDSFRNNRDNELADSEVKLAIRICSIYSRIKIDTHTNLIRKEMEDTKKVKFLEEQYNI